MSEAGCIRLHTQLFARNTMAVVGVLIACVLVVVLGETFFHILPRLCPKIRNVLPSQSTITYVQILPAIIAFPIMLWPFFTVFLPYHVEKPFTSVQGWVHIVFVLFLWTNVMFNYLSTVAISPGYPQQQDEYQQNGRFAITYEVCVKCNRVRRFGTHHCSWCHTCVEMMSHHCPFTNNCIGFRNYVYYLSFLVYLFFALMYSSYVTFSPFAECAEFPMSVPTYLSGSTFMLGTESRLASNSALIKLVDRCEELGDYSLLFAAAAVMNLLIGFLLTYHSVLLLADMSVVDLFSTISNASSVGELLRILYVSTLKRKKTRFIILIYKQKSRWWKFLVPSFVDVHNVPSKDL